MQLQGLKIIEVCKEIIKKKQNLKKELEINNSVRGIKKIKVKKLKKQPRVLKERKKNFFFLQLGKKYSLFIHSLPRVL